MAKPMTDAQLEKTLKKAFANRKDADTMGPPSPADMALQERMISKTKAAIDKQKKSPFAKGGSVKKSRDGIAQRGKTKGRMC